MWWPRAIRIALAVAALFMLAAALFVVERYRRPPLHFMAGVVTLSGRQPGEEVTVGRELRNTGWFPTRITEVTIEGSEGMTPERTVGAMGLSGRGVGGTMAGAPQGPYRLFPLGSFSVPPQRSLSAWMRPTATAGASQAPANYGLFTVYRMAGGGRGVEARDVIIRYRYLGLPMTLRLSAGDSGRGGGQGSGPGPYTEADVLRVLQESGLQAAMGGEISEDVSSFGVKGYAIKVGSETVQVYIYASEEEQRRLEISPDGYGLGWGNRRTAVEWIAPPHFVRKANLVVVVVTSNAQFADQVRASVERLE